MRILTFLTDPPVVSAILLHLHLPHKPPPLSPARGPPQTEADRVWDAVIDVFGDRTWPIDNMERASGLITTDWMRVGERSGDYMDCGSSFGDIDANHQVRLNMVVREDPEGASLTVNTAMRAARSMSGSAYGDPVDCLSTVFSSESSMRRS